MDDNDQKPSPGMTLTELQKFLRAAAERLSRKRPARDDERTPSDQPTEGKKS
jgi:hypothetical protein